MITIFHVSDGYKHFQEAIETYEKRIQKFAIIKRLRPISHTNSEYIKVKETLEIIEVLKKTEGRVILLDERGKGISTLPFAEMIEDARNKSENLIFVIGGSYGLDLELFADIPHDTMKISDFVLPHSLALVTLLEQVYRAFEIIKGSSYHHK